MSKKTSWSLAVLFVALSALAAGATPPVSPAVEPAAVPALAADFTPGPACTKDAEAEAVLAEIAPAPAAASAGETLPTGTGWWFGICLPDFCQRCSSNQDCGAGNTCQYGVQCP